MSKKLSFFTVYDQFLCNFEKYPPKFRLDVWNNFIRGKTPLAPEHIYTADQVCDDAAMYWFADRCVYANKYASILRVVDNDYQHVRFAFENPHPYWKHNTGQWIGYDSLEDAIGPMNVRLLAEYNASSDQPCVAVMYQNWKKKQMDMIDIHHQRGRERKYDD